MSEHDDDEDKLHDMHDDGREEVYVAEKPLTLTLHLSPADVELALTSSGCSLSGPAIRALILARIFDVADLEAAVVEARRNKHLPN